MLKSDDKTDFYGRGWAFPVRSDAGRVSYAEGQEDIRQAILIILQTAPGERVLLPEFGCRITELVFAATNAATFALAELYVKSALERWEPRIQVQAITVSTETRNPYCLLISIDYKILTRNHPDNLVYPFYLKQSSGGAS